MVEDLIEAIDLEFPERSGKDLEAATKAFLRSWGANYWPKMGKLLRGLAKHMPPLPASQQIAKPKQKPDMEEWARQIMRTPIGQESIRLEVASWLWDWCVGLEHPRQQLPSNLVDQLVKKDGKWQHDMAKAAAGAAGPLTIGEAPAGQSQGWARLGIEVNKQREGTLAQQFG